MAKKTKGVAFSNATIDVNDDTIMEFKKDEVTVSKLSAVLQEWDGVEGVSISIRRDETTAILD